MGTAALAVGLLVLAVTVASQVGLGPADFLAVALLGLGGAVFCAVVALEARTHRRRAVVGAGLCLLPVVLIVYFLSVSDG